MKETEKAWLACAIDSEGWVGWSVRYEHRRRYPTIKIANTSRPFLEEVSRIIRREVGAGSIHAEPRPRRPNNKLLHTFHLLGKKACTILEECLPYLIVKHGKALELQSYKPLTPRESQRLVKHHRNRYSK